MILGFTGTEDGLTLEQDTALRALFLILKPDKLNHGVCVGADERAHELIRLLERGGHIPRCFIVGHPGVTKEGKVWRRSECISDCDEVWPEVYFLIRNVNIVRVSEMLVAAPGEMEEIVRSGTWTTVRRARDAGKPIDLVYPDGTITSERMGATATWDLRSVLTRISLEVRDAGE